MLLSQIQDQQASDGALVEQSLRGDHEAFAQLVQRYQRTIFVYICRFLPDYDQACDLCQVVMLQLYRSLPSLHTDEPLRPWLFRVARNRCIDVLRGTRSIPFSLLEVKTPDDELSALEIIADEQPPLEESVERSERVAALNAAIMQLPRKYQHVVVLRYQEQLSFAEIGRQVHMPEATAKTYVQRAKPLLRQALAAHWHLEHIERWDC